VLCNPRSAFQLQLQRNYSDQSKLCRFFIFTAANGPVQPKSRLISLCSFYRLYPASAFSVVLGGGGPLSPPYLPSTFPPLSMMSRSCASITPSPMPVPALSLPSYVSICQSLLFSPKDLLNVPPSPVAIRLLDLCDQIWEFQHRLEAVEARSADRCVRIK
jgi:hypothetical protein